MVHSGYEASSVHYGFNTVRGFLAMARATLFGTYRDSYAKALLNEPVKPTHSYNPLVQIQTQGETQL
jgi:hypothetical protein